MSNPKPKSFLTSPAFSIICLFVALLAAVAVRKFLEARRLTHMNTCINQLLQIDGAKLQWAQDNKRADEDIPRPEDLKRNFPAGLPKCPDGGTYTVGPVGKRPTCNFPGHVMQ
jgi:general secretion pathway protein G